MQQIRLVILRRVLRVRRRRLGQAESTSRATQAASKPAEAAHSGPRTGVEFSVAFDFWLTAVRSIRASEAGAVLLLIVFFVGVVLCQNEGFSPEIEFWIPCRLPTSLGLPVSNPQSRERPDAESPRSWPTRSGLETGCAKFKVQGVSWSTSQLQSSATRMVDSPDPRMRVWLANHNDCHPHRGSWQPPMKRCIRFDALRTYSTQ